MFLSLAVMNRPEEHLHYVLTLFGNYEQNKEIAATVSSIAADFSLQCSTNFTSDKCLGR